MPVDKKKNMEPIVGNFIVLYRIQRWDTFEDDSFLLHNQNSSYLSTITIDADVCKFRW